MSTPRIPGVNPDTKSKENIMGNTRNIAGIERSRDGRFARTNYGIGGDDFAAEYAPRMTTSEPEFDIDELSEKLGQPSTYDPVKAAQLDADLDRTEYVSTAVEVIEEDGLPVIVLTREKLMLVTTPEVEGVTWDDELENTKLHRDVDGRESTDFDELRRHVQNRAENAGINISNIEIRENAVYNYS
jgi:hypothetical protein